MLILSVAAGLGGLQNLSVDQTERLIMLMKCLCDRQKLSNMTVICICKAAVVITLKPTIDQTPCIARQRERKNIIQGSDNEMYDSESFVQLVKELCFHSEQLFSTGAI